MENNLEQLYRDALDLLRDLCQPQGIYASTIDSDNYKRVWSRDSLISGFAGILADDQEIIEGMKRSLLTLANHQHEIGIIPSNALQTAEGPDVSYGSLVGRIDANTWFILGSCLYYLHTEDEDSWNILSPAVEKCRSFIKNIEYNAKGWIYTPLSGNWADEFPTHGYTLYDNLLRIWGESLWLRINSDSDQENQLIKEKTRINFWPNSSSDDKHIYLRRSFDEAVGVKHFCTHILPGHYDTRFDAAANALALLNYDLSSSEKESLGLFLDSVTQDLNSDLVPAFWPVIWEADAEWVQLHQNYAYSFKNRPGYFHNGGIWPVWMGLFCLGLSRNGLKKRTERIVEDFVGRTHGEDWEFQEYLESNDLKHSGKKQMGFTASGVVFMYHAINSDLTKLEKFL